MTTAPFDSSVAQLLAQTHEQTLRCELALGTGQTIQLDPPVDYSIDWDETRSPYVQASFDFPVPATQEILDQIDPRLLLWLSVYVAYRLPSGDYDEQLMARLNVRERKLRRSDDNNAVMTLDCASAELLLIESGGPNVTAGDSVATYSNLKAAVTTFVTDLFAGTPLSTIITTGPTSTTGSVDVPLRPNPWDALSDLADQYDHNIYDPGFGSQFVVEPRVVNVGDVRHTLTVGANGTVMGSATGITRDDWANWVVVTYEWTTAAGVAQVAGGNAFLTGGPYGTSTSGYKILVDNSRQFKGSTAAGNRAAATILRRMLARSRSYVIDAVPAWWLRPGHTIALQLPLGNQERHLLSRVSFAPGRMQLETRLPDTASIIGE